MSDHTVIAELADHVCVIEPESARSCVAPRDAVPVETWPQVSAAPPVDCHASAAMDALWLYTNYDCNLACRHCFLGDAIRTARDERPSLERLVSLVDDAVRLGARTVFITGGEPFAREDLPLLLGHVVERAHAAVLTNATLITPEVIDHLNKGGLTGRLDRLSFRVSIDGPRDVHDAMRGPGTFDRAVEGVRLLERWGVRATLVTALSSRNVRSAGEVTRLAGELGLRYHHLLLPLSGGPAVRASGPEPPTPAEVLAAVRSCRDEGVRSGVTIANDAAIAARVRRPGRRFDGCTGGSSMLVAGADGRFCPCPGLVGREGLSVESVGVAEALHDPVMTEFAAASIGDNAECAVCDVRHLCGGGCVAQRRAGEGRGGPEPYCEVYRGLVRDHMLEQAARSLDDPAVAESVSPEPALSPFMRHRFACT